MIKCTQLTTSSPALAVGDRNHLFVVQTGPKKQTYLCLSDFRILLFHPDWLYTTHSLTLDQFSASAQCPGKWGLHGGVGWPFHRTPSRSPKFSLQSRSCSSSVTAALPLLGIALVLMACIPQFSPDDFKMEQNGVPMAHIFSNDLPTFHILLPCHSGNILALLLLGL